MAKETDFSNERISNFESLVTLTLDRLCSTLELRPTYQISPESENFLWQIYVRKIRVKLDVINDGIELGLEDWFEENLGFWFLKTSKVQFLSL